MAEKKQKPKRIMIDVHGIQDNMDAQARTELDWRTVERYKDELLDGAKFPPVEIFKDVEGKYWMSRGFHRWKAHIKAAEENGEYSKISALVHQGTLRDAILYAVGDNATHGKPRTNADKEKAVETMLKDSEWGEWSNRRIGKLTKVHHKTVGRYRENYLRRLRQDEAAQSSPDLTGACASDNYSKRKYQDKHGNVSTMDTSGIGRSKKPKGPQPDPTAYQIMKDTPAADDDEQLAQLAELPEEEQLDVAGALHNGEADTVEQAITVAKEKKQRAHTKQVMTSSKSVEHPTDPRFMEVFYQTFGRPSLDVCATAENAKAERFYTEEDDGLKQSWYLKEGFVWMNPPYGRYGDGIAKWMHKAFQTAMSGLAEVFCLPPVATGRLWWYNYACRGHVYFLVGRLTFEGQEHSAPFDNALIHFPRNMGAGFKPQTKYWDYRNKYMAELPEFDPSSPDPYRIIRDQAFVGRRDEGDTLKQGQESLIWLPHKLPSREKLKEAGKELSKV